MMEWISADIKLPLEGKYVLGIHNRGTWHDSSDQDHVNMVIVKICRGISIAEREAMKSGEMEDYESGPYGSCFGSSMCKRSTVTKGCDESGNNKRPYNWESFGPSSFSGQSITHWCELPPPPVEYTTGKNKHVPIIEKVEAMVGDAKRNVSPGILDWLNGHDKKP